MVSPSVAGGAAITTIAVVPSSPGGPGGLGGPVLPRGPRWMVLVGRLELLLKPCCICTESPRIDARAPHHSRQLLPVDYFLLNNGHRRYLLLDPYFKLLFYGMRLWHAFHPVKFH